MLTVALAKGRLLKSFIAYLNEVNEQELVRALEQRERQLLISVGEIQFVLVKGSDVPIYVEQGVADVGIVGSDILEEGNYTINNLLDLPFGACHFALAAKPDTTTFTKVATSYTKTARKYFEAQGLDVELVKLSGSIELACLVDMVDGIVDIVQTGTTLKSNGLVEKDTIKNINAKLITNKQSYFKKSAEIDDFIQTLEVSLIDYK
ncbi:MULTISPECIES: ATP phosphoribosyltransferase [Staphylococcus]|jgi:ATP phosphoribosyltransferase|uniref:ATP phosphoribosyltransferase n=2 Tax=Staphylococcus equorum TaxID=246432 RepID=A0AAP7IDI3_9STAP|nr:MULTISPECIES: ATP phosphoribosyltransferase [Staphylococcus]MDN6111914.1 ATP phosphoribosyltransferase [Tetragenococcus halophilus]MDN6140104.1 ATP phosphoribosyltransferase [Tetragenococcus koreensis]ALM57919.1 ATP phosphoribosyltransferase [Staphylococcus equorum]ANK39078.1 ATP phosphoribosyltransferase [Staphylococcus sp. AntiMn-1]EJX18575.1 ATP phosphoribosyltransferase catalytic subunit [Staphylococcus sp. OJ82]